MNSRAWNWRLWVGFTGCIVTLVIYSTFIEPARLLFWLSLLLFAGAGTLLISGLYRALAQPQSYRGKIAGPILTVLSLSMITLFGFEAYWISKLVPTAANAPTVGSRAPEFTLVNTSAKPVSLSEALKAPITDGAGAVHPVKGVLLVFYRGYW
jgi:hypothetical protein